ncbi:ATP synthase subunit I [Effusibacillus pohliae]|uniref:ATP synthase subunit I n=1 Tax=Effusibacillus pohliae TaxID=232270 RepID=UPI0003788D23|nr:ATP synthase subunit I [Effusibacillus pohliae]
MEEARQLVRRTVTWTLLITVVWIVLWVVAPAWKSIFSGLAIGAAVSVYFAVSVARQAEMAMAVAMRGGRKKPVMPFIARIAVVAFAVMVAHKLAYPNVYAMIAALFTHQIVIFVDMFAHRKKDQHSKPEGVK